MYRLLQCTVRHKQYRTKLHICRVPIRTMCGREFPTSTWKPAPDMTVEQAVERGETICEMCLSNWRADMEMEAA